MLFAITITANFNDNLVDCFSVVKQFNPLKFCRLMFGLHVNESFYIVKISVSICKSVQRQKY